LRLDDVRHRRRIEMSVVIAGDIGGTKTRLASVEVRGTQLRPRDGEAEPSGAGVAASHLLPQTAGFASNVSKVRIEREADYRSRDFATFEALLADFLQDAPAPVHAAFGIAGPVRGRAVRATNLPWYIEADGLQQRFGFKTCMLLNDLEATAYGLPALGAEDLLTLQPGAQDARGNAAIIAAGTGLGEAGLYWDGRQHHPYATEGGHTSFSPQSELEMDLLRYLQRRYVHVSWERVVSGMGLLDLHDFLRSYRKAAVPQWLEEELRTGDAAAAISRAALAGSDDICIETLECFARLYGAEAGNLALKTMSRGGVYVGGGIAPKILPLLQRDLFMQAFLNKGRMLPLLEAMPVRAILNDRVALYGPALCAGRHEAG
jgi:glucokinase